jgi:hypothetical protein
LRRLAYFLDQISDQKELKNINREAFRDGF